jgi:hypothetical protein
MRVQAYSIVGPKGGVTSACLMLSFSAVQAAER